MQSSVEKKKRDGLSFKTLGEVYNPMEYISNRNWKLNKKNSIEMAFGSCIGGNVERVFPTTRSFGCNFSPLMKARLQINS